MDEDDGEDVGLDEDEDGNAVKVRGYGVTELLRSDDGVEDEVKIN